MTTDNAFTKKVVVNALMFAASQVAVYYSLRWVLDSMGPTGDRKDAKAKSAGILKRLGHTDLKLNEYEGACVVQS